MKKITTWVAVVGLALAAGGGWWWQNRADSGAGAGASAGAGAGPSAPGAPGAGAPGAPQGAAGGAPGAAGRPGGGPGGPATVEVAKVEVMRLTDDVQAVGSIKSSQGVMLRPEVSGRISKLGFSDGQRVQRGQLLVQFDDTLQQAQLKQAQAQAEIARTRLQRNRELMAQGFVSQSAVDQSIADQSVAEAQVALAQAQLARYRVLAPFDGTAGLKLVDVGDYLKDGADIVNIEDLNALTVQFPLPERTVSRVKAGLPVELTLDAVPGRVFAGRILAVDSQVDANGRALQVLARVTNTGAVLKPGMFARARVVFAVRESALVVPEEALVPQGARQFLFKVVSGPDGKKVSQRLEAKIGLRMPGKVEILAGLQAGDEVVTAGHTRLLRADSVPVRVIDLTRLPQAGGGGRPPGAAGATGGTAAAAIGTAKPGSGAGAAVNPSAASESKATAMPAAANGPASAPVGRPIAQP